MIVSIAYLPTVYGQWCRRHLWRRLPFQKKQEAALDWPPLDELISLQQ